jgi:type IV pilus assembly protein PilE
MNRDPRDQTPSGATPSRTRGFTLIELMIAVVVLGILSALAYPSFMDAIYKGRRSEAFAALTSVQLAQERYRANSASYATSLAVLYAALQTTAPGSSNYNLSIPAADANSYTLRAVANGAQHGDSRCRTMDIQVTGGTVNYGSACATCTMASPLTDPNRCWSRQ